MGFAMAVLAGAAAMTMQATPQPPKGGDAAALSVQATPQPPKGGDAAAMPGGRMVGMYVHQHWPYNHPYAARTWTVADWRGYAGGLKLLGFNTILIWPIMETMPNPLTPSDRASLNKIGKVIDMLHKEHKMRVYIVICPNISAKNEEARKATFENRHYYYCEDLVNPRDPVALKKLVDWRETLMKPVKNVDGVAIIDSDPGGWPGSTNEEFVNLLDAHRKMFDRVRPGIELLYWMHAGWRGWGRLYETGKLNTLGTPAEHEETVKLLMAKNPEPWGMANGLPIAKKLGIEKKIISFNYGMIEAEPSFPMTNFTGDRAYAGASSDAPRGVMGNAQTHCVQLPNTFAFSRGAAGKPITEADWNGFADDLIPGYGHEILAAWRNLSGGDAQPMLTSAVALERIASTKPEGGRLKGLLFGSPVRFLNDLTMMLRQKAAIEEFAAAVSSGSNPKAALKSVIDHAGAWQKVHGFKNNWYDPKLQTALAKFDHPAIKNYFSVTYEVRTPVEPGKSYFEAIRTNFALIETHTLRLLDAMKQLHASLP